MWATSFAVGEDYCKEIDGLVNSIRKNSPTTNLIIGKAPFLKKVDDEFEITIYTENFSKVEVASKKILDGSTQVNNWESRCLLKPSWILSSYDFMTPEEKFLWIDADARVRGDLSQCKSIIHDDKIVAAVASGDEYLAGFIIFNEFDDSFHFLETWQNDCIGEFHSSKAKFPDQHFFNKSINNWCISEQMLIVQRLDDKWGSIAPMITGSPLIPKWSKPPRDNAIIWHWQASRKRKGWNWPPKEELR